MLQYSQSHLMRLIHMHSFFLSVPVCKESQFLFAFNFNSKGYTFTRPCHGYGESPTIYRKVLKCCLDSVTLCQNLHIPDKQIWTEEVATSSDDMKLAFQQPATVDLPDAAEPFNQTVDERNGFMTSVLLQEPGAK